MKCIRNITAGLTDEARCKISIETDGREHLDNVERDKLAFVLRELADIVSKMSAPDRKSVDKIVWRGVEYDVPLVWHVWGSDPGNAMVGVASIDVHGEYVKHLAVMHLVTDEEHGSTTRYSVSAALELQHLGGTVLLSSCLGGTFEPAQKTIEEAVQALEYEIDAETRQLYCLRPGS